MKRRSHYPFKFWRTQP